MYKRQTKNKATGETTRYTVAHWCTTEARFRNHLKKVKPDAATKLLPLDNMLVRITQQDVVYRRYLTPGHRAYIPEDVYKRQAVYVPRIPPARQPLLHLPVACRARRSFGLIACDARCGLSNRLMRTLRIQRESRAHETHCCNDTPLPPNP